MNPKLISGNRYSDQRGTLLYNNNFDASLIKRIYIIENEKLELIRGWQGHQIEQRWFSAVIGRFEIQLIKIDNWEKPSKDLEVFTYLIDSEELNVLYVPNGYISSIQSLELNSKLLVMADYLLGENKDEYRFDIEYFKI
ncbi:WxcM-like domain-containing protein [Flavobacterium gilvum]|uniref:Sugar epimerase n=1 Tax=Flavobacterium gilvum TaxID=1492737 RepID=A0AAC9I299_9FLAO|nr:WxcM-like domain-containing protein [Flavobacterium gilvum]AOW08151.1 sugar epimerase [Flavobacterium gilvum]KFC59356.1 sugar epimerase [Flavobacterium gilvum]